MAQYRVVVVSDIRQTNTYEVEAEDSDDAVDIVFADDTGLISSVTKHLDSDSWVEEIQ